MYLEREWQTDTDRHARALPRITGKWNLRVGWSRAG